MSGDRPPEQRLPAPECASKRLPVAVPQLPAVPEPVGRANEQPPHRRGERQGEPDHPGCRPRPPLSPLLGVGARGPPPPARQGSPPPPPGIPPPPACPR